MHTCRKYYKLLNVLYSFQDRNDVILIKINMSLTSQRRELVIQGTQKNQRSMDVSALAVIQIICHGISV